MSDGKTITKIVRASTSERETPLCNLPDSPDCVPTRYYFYEQDDGDTLLLTRPGSKFRFVSLRDPLKRSPEDKASNGHRAHKWSGSVREAVEHAMDRGHTVYRVDTYGELSMRLRQKRWSW